MTLRGACRGNRRARGARCALCYTVVMTMHTPHRTSLLGGCAVSKRVHKEDMPAFAQEVLEAWRRDVREHPHTDHAVVVALLGELGAGKTALAQQVAHALGVKDVVTSPTFVIQKSYATQDADFETLVHIDAYRIDDLKELSVLGFEKTLRAPKTLVLIEWANRIESLLPPDTLCVSLLHEGEGERRVEYGTYADCS